QPAPLNLIESGGAHSVKKAAIWSLKYSIRSVSDICSFYRPTQSSLTWWFSSSLRLRFTSAAASSLTDLWLTRLEQKLKRLRVVCTPELQALPLPLQKPAKRNSLIEQVNQLNAVIRTFSIRQFSNSFTSCRCTFVQTAQICPAAGAGRSVATDSPGSSCPYIYNVLVRWCAMEQTKYPQLKEIDDILGGEDALGRMRLPQKSAVRNALTCSATLFRCKLDQLTSPRDYQVSMRQQWQYIQQHHKDFGIASCKPLETTLRYAATNVYEVGPGQQLGYILQKINNKALCQVNGFEYNYDYNASSAN
uniref:PNT domain-containing protein n=1 Tax=Macrostomum lignano TaxID=282301 RepID=A0A1I8FQ98_9PLAT